uniref:Uncharacterized protein n=1 Tax=Anguilla anguilla TaxID=7936 RepID=A0A0E9VAG7_ANGAN
MDVASQAASEWLIFTCSILLIHVISEVLHLPPP